MTETTPGSILSYIPQRAPFVMVDKMISCNETTCRTGFLVRPDNIFVENGTLKEPGLAENIAQSAAVRAGYLAGRSDEPAPVGYIGGIKNFEVMQLPKTGDELVTEITMVHQIFDVILVSGKVFAKEQLLAQCEMKIFINKIK
jgi:predicted hotdog family 3-hydroxylacyl-ACP dehydratase